MAKRQLLEEVYAENQRDDTGPPIKKHNSRDIVRSGVSFNNLPLEIRNMIWEWVFYPGLESRIYIPGALLKGVEPYPDYQHGIPQSLRVCKEARDVAYRKREWVDIWQDEGQKPIRALVDPERDALYYDNNWDIARGFEKIRHVFETIIITPRRGTLSVILLREWCATFKLSSNLKKIQVVCQAYDWGIPRRSVGTNNSFLVFDLDKKTDMKRLSALRSLHPDSKISAHPQPWNNTSDSSVSEMSDSSVSEISDSSVSEMSDSSVSEMSDRSVSETSDHSDTNISWEDVDEDIRELQTSSLPLSVVNGTGEVLDGPVECPYLWLRDCAGSGASDQYVYLPEEAIVEPQSHRFFEVHVIKLPWLALNAILSQIWEANLDNKPTFQRVIQFYLE